MTNSPTPAKSPLELARQGDPAAIAALLNQSLNADEVKAKVVRQGDLLKIGLLGRTPPDPSLCPRIVTGLQRLQIVDVSQCRIMAYQVNQRQPLWAETLALTTPVPEASAVTPPPPTFEGNSIPQRPTQRQIPANRDRPVKLSKADFWKRGVAFLFSVPLIVHGSLRFLLTLETQLFGISTPAFAKPTANLFSYFSEQLFGSLRAIYSASTIDNIWLFLFINYGGSLVALFLGLVAIRYALKENKPFAKKLSTLLIVLPSIFVILCLISNPYLLIPSKLGRSHTIFFHPVTGMTISRTFQIILIALNVILLAVLGRILFNAVIRSYMGSPGSFWQEITQKWRALWRGQKNSVTQLLALGLALLLVTNPGPVRHVKVTHLASSFRANLANIGQVRGADVKAWLSNSDNDYYRTLLVFSWLGNRYRGPMTFGFAGHCYRRAFPTYNQEAYTRFDLLNPGKFF